MTQAARVLPAVGQKGNFKTAQGEELTNICPPARTFVARRIRLSLT